MIWFVEVGFGGIQSRNYELIEADTQAAAERIARVVAISNAESFDYYQDPGHFGNLDGVGLDYDEETGEYADEGELYYELVPYNEEEHEGYL